MPAPVQGTLVVGGLKTRFLLTRGLQTETAQTFAVNPGRIRPSATTTVNYIGTSTNWLTSSPTITASGTPTGAGWSVGSLVIVDDTHAHRTVTAGATTGTVTWADSSSGLTATMTVARTHYQWPFTRRYRR